MKAILIGLLSILIFAGFQQSTLTNVNQNLDSMWEEVKSLESKYQWDSAKKVVEKIRKQAQSDNATPHVVKANLYILKYDALKDESIDDTILTYNGLLSLIEKAQDPTVKAVYKAQLAFHLQNFYTRESYRFSSRTDTDEQNFNLETTSAKQIIELIKKYYFEAIKDKALANTAHSKWHVLMTENDFPDIYETYWDVVVLEAFNFVLREGSMLDFDNIEDAALLAETSVDDFVNLDFANTSNKSFLICLLQDLLIAKKGNPEASALVDEKRRSYFINKSALKNDTEKAQAIWESYWNAHKKQAPIIASHFYITKAPSITLVDKNEIIEGLNLNVDKLDYWGTEIYNYQKSQITNKAVSLKTNSLQLADKPILAFIEHKNITSTKLRIYKLNTIEQLKNTRYNAETGDFVKEVELSLPSYTDFENHSVEVMLEALPSGNYQFKIEDNLIYITVSDHRLSSIMDDNESQVVIFDSRDGTRLTNKKLSYYTWENKKNAKIVSATFELDKSGLTNITGKVNQQQNTYVKIEEDNGHVFLPINKHYYYKDNPYAFDFITFFTDRTLYRPGQTVYFKGIVNHQENRKAVPTIVANRKVQLSIRDANYTEIKTIQLVSNEYGSIEGSFALPTELLNGSFSINSDLGNHSFRVEEYKRPKFELSFETPTELFSLNDNITLKGSAMAYAGYPIENAKVKYTVTRETNYYRGSWFWHYTPEPAVVIKNGATTTDKDGNYDVKFNALVSPTVDLKADPKFRYVVNATVTDINGETHDINYDLTIGVTKYRVEIPIKQVYKADDLGQIPFKITNNQGEKVSKKGMLKVELVQAPIGAFRGRPWTVADKVLYSEKDLHAVYPYLPYGEIPALDTWRVEKKVKEFSINGADEKVAIPNLKPGIYRVTVEVDGSKAKNEQVFFVWDKSGVPAQMPADIYLSDKTVEVGTEMDATFIYPVKAEPLFYSQFMREAATFLDLKEQKGKSTYKKNILKRNRGGGQLYMVFYKDGQLQEVYKDIKVPYLDKQLKFNLSTFRDKVKPGSKEKYTLKVMDWSGNRVDAEILATMYDASLDAIAPYGYQVKALPTFRSIARPIHTAGFLQVVSWRNTYTFKTVEKTKTPRLISLMDTRGRNVYPRMYRSMSPEMENSKMAMDVMVTASEPTMATAGNQMNQAPEATQPKKPVVLSPRTNLNETVFFYPTLQTDANGETSIEFTMNEALTKWKLMLFAHTKENQEAYLEKTLVTQKEVMVVPQLPRFLTSGDKLSLKSKVVNLTDEPQTLEVSLDLKGLGGEVFTDLMKNQTQTVTLEAKGSVIVEWPIEIPESLVEPVEVVVMASNAAFSDGEKNIIPVLSNRILVRESMPFYVNGETTKQIEWKRLMDLQKSSTLIPQNFTFQLTENPLWEAVAALPYMTEYPYDCSEQIFSRLFGFTIANHLTKTNPALKESISKWEIEDPDAFMSALEKDQKLKNALLEATPWVLEAKDETEQKRKLKLLLDLNHSSQKMKRAIGQLAENQQASGGYPWFKGGKENWYVTQHITIGLVKLKKMGALADHPTIDGMILEGAKFCQEALIEYHSKRKKDKLSISPIVLQHLYLASLYSMPENEVRSKLKATYMELLEKDWNTFNDVQNLATAGIIFHYNQNPLAVEVAKSLRESSVESDEKGMYWKNTSSYFWYTRPVEAQTMAIELFDLLEEKETLTKLKRWLLVHKRTNHWETTTATTAAILALIDGRKEMLDSKPFEYTVTKDGLGLEQSLSKAIKQKDSYAAKVSATVQPESLGSLELTIKNNNKVQAFGGLHVSYLETMDKVSGHSTDEMTVKQEIFIKRGQKLLALTEDNAEIGDEVVYRLIVELDRPMEFLHLKMMRAAGLEPKSTLSGHRYNAGMMYYENIKDVSVDLFFDYIGRGKYVFEYSYDATVAGAFQNGITTLQSMYAPEFSSHTAGENVIIK